MQVGNSQHTRLIAWNGVRLVIPEFWETRVAAPCHLVFEEEFQPLLQLRWQKKTDNSPKNLQQIISAFSEQAETVIATGELTGQWLQHESKFEIFACSGDKNGTLSGGIFCCPKCHTLFQFQIFTDTQPVRRQASGNAIVNCLATLSCHGHREELWRIQDFSLSTPPAFSLTDYSFGAGLTRLSFHTHDLKLDTCKLAPADVRLSRQSLAEILLTLTAAPDLEIRESPDTESCEGFRTPGITSRVLLRMRRNKPFVRAGIRHDSTHNRLLALVITGSRPIPGDMLPTLAGNYAIV
ncbi:MAG: hypothetical protein VR65_14805 [Desulfobulbaceae bacterium BRH_c16a]|nr:MAG: hypothetical protein VR65_14805 [Desulfobulbaceae bacterium BRH_c16a]